MQITLSTCVVTTLQLNTSIIKKQRQVKTLDAVRKYLEVEYSTRSNALPKTVKITKKYSICQVLIGALFNL